MKLLFHSVSGPGSLPPLCVGPGAPRRSLCRGPALSRPLRRSPPLSRCALCVGAPALSVSGRRSLCQGPALFGSLCRAWRSLCRGPALSISALCVGLWPGVSASGPGTLYVGPTLSVSGPGDLCVGPTLSVSGPPALSSLCRARRSRSAALSVSGQRSMCRGPGALCVGLRHSRGALCVGLRHSRGALCVRRQHSLCRVRCLCRVCVSAPLALSVSGHALCVGARRYPLSACPRKVPQVPEEAQELGRVRPEAVTNLDADRQRAGIAGLGRVPGRSAAATALPGATFARGCVLHWRVNPCHARQPHRAVGRRQAREEGRSSPGILMCRKQNGGHQ